MNVKFLTPIQLWQGFDAESAPLEIAVVYSKNANGIDEKGVYFTAITEDNEPLRVYATLRAPENVTNKAIIRVLMSNGQADLINGYVSWVSQGYAEMTINIGGKDDSFGHATQYGAKYDYANMATGNVDRFLATPSAKSSPIFLWARIVRRAITLLKYFYPMVEPVILGVDDSADILWQVASSDSRVKGLISILGDYSEPIANEKNSSNEDSWMMCLSAKSVAKQVKCPCFMATASSAPDGDIDKISEVVAQMAEDVKVQMAITPRLVTQIDERTLNAAHIWAENLFSGKKLLTTPSLTVEGDKFLTFSLKETETKIKSVTLYYCYNKTKAEYRNWNETPMQMVSKGTFTAEVHATKGDTQVFAYASVLFEDGTVLASKEISSVVVSDEPISNSHFICDTASAHGFFSDTSNKSHLWAESDFAIATAPNGVPAFRANGTLISNILSDVNHYEVASLLHISVYSEEDGEIRIVLHKKNGDDVTKYTAIIQVEGGEWTQAIADVDDFKTEELIPMKDWDNLLRIELPDTEGKYYNNLLWI